MPKLKRNYDLYSKPDEVEVENLNDVSFSSHQSFLTNKRLHELLIMCDFAGISAGTTFQIDDIGSYRASLWGVYIIVESVLNDEQRKEILDSFSSFDDYRFRPSTDPKTRYIMYTMLSDIHRIIYNSLQTNGQYFFRMETHPVKGIRNINKFMGFDKLKGNETEEKDEVLD